MKGHITRRTFLKGGSLAVGATLLHGKLHLFKAASAEAGEGVTFRPHAFVEIATDDTVTVWIGQTNLGQGTHTGISMIVAEELDADWQKVRAKMALAGEAFKDPNWHAQLTGGSTSIRHRWDLIRKAGAAARQMLIEAAAKEWGVDPGRCRTDSGKVVHPDGRSLSYGQLVAKARELEVPEDPPLKNAKDYRIIGSARDRLDIPDKVEGRAVYGIDMSVPGMCVAVVARPPRYGATPEGYDEGAAMAVKGVIKVVPLEGKVAVCADNTWAAMQGREKLAVKWSKGSDPELNSAKIDALFEESLGRKGAAAETVGDAEKALGEAATTVESSFRVPFLAHAALEPINCTAHVEKDRCRVWVPTQGQTAAQHTAAAIAGLPPEKVEVMTTYVGGGFGLRGETDPVVDAVTLSKETGRPVKVVWTREDDFANDYFRPGAASTIRGGLDRQGRLTAWSQKVASPSIGSRSMPDAVQNGVDALAIHGIPDMPYRIPNRFIEYVLMDLPVPVGFWRSVGYTYTIFMVESFVDELAHAAKRDPVEFRLEHMEKGSRPYGALKLLADMVPWGGAVPEGRSRGVAVGSCFGSSAAHMAEVSVDRATGKVKVHKVVCALDCGTVVYPDAVAAQMEGGAVMALSAAFHEKVGFSGGGVGTVNFDEYPLLTISEVPEIEVHTVKSAHPIGGVGEPGVPPVAPAVANAIFKATGVRLRELPFDLGKLKKA